MTKWYSHQSGKINGAFWLLRKLPINILVSMAPLKGFTRKQIVNHGLFSSTNSGLNAHPIFLPNRTPSTNPHIIPSCPKEKNKSVKEHHGFLSLQQGLSLFQISVSLTSPHSHCLSKAIMEKWECEQIIPNSVPAKIRIKSLVAWSPQFLLAVSATSQLFVGQLTTKIDSLKSVFGCYLL